MTLAYLAIALWVVLVINALARRFADWVDRPLTEFDRRCSRIDAELDELAARHATRPHTDGVVVVGPWRGGGAA